MIGTQVRVAKATWRDAPSIKTFTQTGYVGIQGICMEGGRARLVRDSERLLITSITPNPASSHIQIDVHGTPESTVDVMMHDAIGRCIRTETINLSDAGSAAITFNVHELPSGVYSIGLISAAQRVNTTVVINR